MSAHGRTYRLRRAVCLTAPLTYLVLALSAPAQAATTARVSMAPQCASEGRSFVSENWG